MPLLKKEGRLLKIVQHKPHATAEDHDDSNPYPTPASTSSARTPGPRHMPPNDDQEDPDREPDSSSDEASVAPAKQNTSLASESLSRDFPSFGLNVCTRSSQISQLERLQVKPDASQIPHGTKRSSPSSNDDDDALFADVLRDKRAKMTTTYSANQHVAQDVARKRQVPTVSSVGSISLRKGKRTSRPPGFKKAREVEPLNTSPPKKGFTRPVQALRNTQESPTQQKSGFRLPTMKVSMSASAVNDTETWHDLGSDLDSLPSPLPDDGLDPDTFNCEICGENLDIKVRRAFELEYCDGKAMNYKWQKRFCRHHKQQRAADAWKERGYPEIVWERLGMQMRKHKAFLVRVLNDDVPSVHRSQLKDRLKNGAVSVNSALAKQTKVKEGDESDESQENDKNGLVGKQSGTAVGYYGPRGEKMMIDHIMKDLRNEIKAREKKDQILRTVGVQGGVPGFVQAVLLPHLAELLVKEDMKLQDDWEAEARRIIDEGAELGELVHPEAEDKVIQIDDAGA